MYKYKYTYSKFILNGVSCFGSNDTILSLSLFVSIISISESILSVSLFALTSIIYWWIIGAKNGGTNDGGIFTGSILSSAHNNTPDIWIAFSIKNISNCCLLWFQTINYN